MRVFGLVIASLFALWISPALALDQVVLQLKWHHQFQFAGYYAAKELGYYREAGLDVTINPVTNQLNPLDQVLEGRAQYGVGTNDLLLLRNRGKPVVVLGVMFQHSPYVLLAMQDRGIESVHDLIGKRVMIDPYATEILAYLKRMNVPLEKLVQIKSFDYEYKDLMSGKTDAYAGYSTNDPYYLDKAHVRYLSFSPRSEGIDFYGDNLFTTESEVKAHPERAKRFLEASLKGWQYAVKNPEKMADLMIAAGYFPAGERDKLLYEARKLIQLMHPDLVEIGYQHAGRWKHIGDTYVEVGMLPKDYSLEGFMYQTAPSGIPAWAKWLIVLSLLAAMAISGVATYIYRKNRELFRRLFQFSNRFEKIVGRVPGVVYQFRMRPDGSFCFPFASEALRKIFRIDPDEVRDDAAKVLAQFHPDDLRLFLDEVRYSARHMSSWQREFRLVFEDGAVRWVLCNSIPEREPDGAITWHGVISDVTDRKQAEQALAQREQEFRTLAENVPDILVRYDLACRRVYFNHAYLHANGESATVALGKTPKEFWTVISPTAEEYTEDLHQVISRKETLELTFLLDDGGQPIYHAVLLVPECDSSGSVTGVLSISRNITGIKRMEAMLRKSELEFRTLAENSPEMIVRYDRDCRRIYINPAYKQQVCIPLDQSPNQPVEEAWKPLMPLEEYKARLCRVMETGKPDSILLEWYGPDGALVSHLMHVVAEYDENGNVLGALVIGLNISELKATERRLQESRAMLRAMTAQREAALEEERKRIAREIHDELGQLLNVLRLNITTLDYHFGVANSDLHDKAGKMVGTVDRAILIVRNLATRLRPAVLDSGVALALEWMLEEFSDNTGIECLLHLPDHEIALDAERSTVVFRIVQESLTNALRHSGATRIDVALSQQDGMLEVTIRDNGKGFEPGKGRRKNAFGIVGMQERALMLDGDLEVLSAPDKGAMLRLRIPLDAPKNSADGVN